MGKENKRRDSDDQTGVGGIECVRRKQRLVFFYTGGKSDSVPDNEYDQDKQMKYRNNNDSQNESEV